jgi:hypothetical protein
MSCESGGPTKATGFDFWFKLVGVGSPRCWNWRKSQHEKRIFATQKARPGVWAGTFFKLQKAFDLIE